MSDERALSFGSVAEDYEATRPGWPREPFSAVFEHFGVPGRPDIVDVAAGTGKLTRTLVPLAGSLVAVEPDPSLREVIQRVLSEVDVFAGTAEALPLETASADVVCAGQAFHWFDVQRALTEIARVLRPDGVVVAAWNSPPEDGTWYDAVIEFLHVANPDHLPAQSEDWAAALSHLPTATSSRSLRGTNRRATMGASRGSSARTACSTCCRLPTGPSSSSRQWRSPSSRARSRPTAAARSRGAASSTRCSGAF